VKVGHLHTQSKWGEFMFY